MNQKCSHVYIWQSAVSPIYSPSRLVGKKSTVTVGVEGTLNRRTELRRRVWRMVVSFTILCGPQAPGNKP